MRLALALLSIVAAALTGCGLGPGEERGGGGADLRVTRDFGHRLLSSESDRAVREGDTVMRFLRADHDVETRFGGGFVQSIDGLSGRGVAGSHDWFFYVNGIEASEGAADYGLSPGDVVHWDYRDWSGTMDVRAIVGAYPQPFLDGLDGKRFPVRVECEHSSSDPCRDVKQRLRALGVPATGAALGAPGGRRVARVVVAEWDRVRELPSARAIELGPERSGVFARFVDEGAELELLGPDEQVVEAHGPGTGLIAALRPTDDELLWLVTGVDDAGLARAVEALRADALRDAFAVAVLPGGVRKLPLEAAE